MLIFEEKIKMRLKNWLQHRFSVFKKLYDLVFISSAVKYFRILRSTSAINNMYEKVATVTVSIEETVSLAQGERGPDRDSYFPSHQQ